jgi:predicted DNA-binding transcriptional regulator YafY
MSSTPHDTTTKKRVLEILRILIENPGHYTRKDLAEVYGVNTDTISRDFRIKLLIVLMAYSNQK